MSTRYGYWDTFCRDSGNLYATIPVCNLFLQSPASSATPSGWEGCNLTGIPLGGDRRLANLGSIILCGIAILASAFLIFLSERKKAAVGRREMQLFLLGYVLIEICEILTTGGFPLRGEVRRGFSAAHIALVVATTWILVLNAVVGFQFLDDGTALSIGLMVLSAGALFVGSGYIALDTGFNFTGYWEDTRGGENLAYALYTLYQLVPLVFLVVFFLLETFLVLRILGERKPMIYLVVAALLFAIGQVFQYVVSVHICTGTDGKINGGLFETLFTLLAVVTVWFFWSSITEDDWPMPSSTGGAYT